MLHACVLQENEPTLGRLLVFSVEGQGAERKVHLVEEEETRGAVYVLNGFNGKLLAGINSKVRSNALPRISAPSCIGCRMLEQTPDYHPHV